MGIHFSWNQLDFFPDQGIWKQKIHFHPHVQMTICQNPLQKIQKTFHYQNWHPSKIYQDQIIIWFQNIMKDFNICKDLDHWNQFQVTFLWNLFMIMSKRKKTFGEKSIIVPLEEKFVNKLWFDKSFLNKSRNLK